MQQDLSQSETYASRIGYVRTCDLAIPHAARAYARLCQDYGPEAARSPLGLALALRASLDGSQVDDRAGVAGMPALRDAGSGRFVGAIRPDRYRRA